MSCATKTGKQRAPLMESINQLPAFRPPSLFPGDATREARASIEFTTKWFNANMYHCESVDKYWPTGSDVWNLREACDKYLARNFDTRRAYPGDGGSPQGHIQQTSLKRPADEPVESQTAARSWKGGLASRIAVVSEQKLRLA